MGTGRTVAAARWALPMVDVHTVGAGGGSIAWRDAGGALRVGPDPQARDPGPACYGKGGGRPTVTDANLLLGYLDADSPLAGGVELDRDAAEKALGAAGELDLSVEETAAGVAGWRAWDGAGGTGGDRGAGDRPTRAGAGAVRGAGPLHAARIADELGMRRVLVPVASGVLSALGLVVSERRRDMVESVLLAGELTREKVADVVERLAERGREELDAPDAQSSGHLRPALRRPGLRALGAGRARPDPDELRRAFDRRTRSATATRIRRPSWSW